MKRKLILLLLPCLLIACREDFSIELPDTETSLNLFAELTPGNRVEVGLFSSLPFGQDGQLKVPEDAIMFLTGTDMSTHVTDLVYNQNAGRYVLSNLNFTPKENNYYEITAYIPNVASDTIKARTYLPKASRITDIEILSNERLTLSSDLFNHRLQVRIYIEEPEIKPAYFNLIPRRIISNFRETPSGQIFITDTNVEEQMDIEGVLSYRNAITELSHRQGIFIDHSRLDKEAFVELQLICHSPLSSLKDVLNLLRFELRTLTKELYDYHHILNRHLISSHSEYSHPVTSYTNITNGKGLFGAYSISYATIELK